MANLIYSIVIFLNTLSIVALVFIVLQVRKRILLEFHDLYFYIFSKVDDLVRDKKSPLEDDFNKF